LGFGISVKAFFEQLPELLKTHRNQYALIHDDQITIHQSCESAHAIGFDKYGSMSEFMVLKIEPRAQLVISDV